MREPERKPKSALALAKAAHNLTEKMFLAPEPRDWDREQRWSHAFYRLEERLDAIPADAPAQIEALKIAQTQQVQSWCRLMAEIAKLDPSWAADTGGEEPDPSDPQFRECYDPWEGLRQIAARHTARAGRNKDAKAEAADREADVRALVKLAHYLAEHGEPFERHTPIDSVIAWVEKLRILVVALRQAVLCVRPVWRDCHRFHAADVCELEICPWSSPCFHIQKTLAVAAEELNDFEKAKEAAGE